MSLGVNGNLTRLPESVLHAIHRQAETEERAGREILRLHVGEPSFRPPDAVREAIARAMADGRTGYTAAEGLPELRHRLADRLAAAGIDARGDRVLVTPGSSQALATIMLSVAGPGAEILLPAIHWPIYAQGAAVAGLRVATYPLDADHGIDPGRFAAAIGPATRLVVLNSPANPTGAVTPADRLAELVAISRRAGVWVIGDEAYEQFVYDGEHLPCAAVERDLPEAERRVFSVHTFSKSYGMTGYRVGYVAAPTAEAATALRRISEGTIIAPSTPVQHGALAALDDEDMPRRARGHVLATRDAALAPASATGLLARPPAAGWYALIDVAATGLDSATFTDGLLAAERVAVAPGAAFVSPTAPDPRCVRVAFCGDTAMAVEGMHRLVRYAGRLRGSTRPPVAAAVDGPREA